MKIIGILFLAAVCAVFWYNAVASFRRGQLRVGGGDIQGNAVIRKADRPKTFWVLVCLQFMIGVGFLALVWYAADRIL